MDLAGRSGAGVPERRALASAWGVLRFGTTVTVLLMVLPGLLSPDPVANSLIGAVVGLSATAVVAFAAYVWVAYVEPWRVSARRPAPVQGVGRVAAGFRLHRRSA
jgi:hypothetical protein